MKQDEIGRLAEAVLAASAAERSIAPLSDARPDFGLDDAYEVAARVAELRIARGERPVGWKIGFTNTTIWDEYGVHAPIWGPMYDSTVAAIGAEGAPAICPLDGLVEPRIEPEIVLRLANRPQPGMDERELLACIDAVAHGFEIVQSLFPEWRFKAADTVAAFALHGRLRHGPFISLTGLPTAEWLAGLSSFQIRLFRDGELVDSGDAANVLGGPLSALRHFVAAKARYPSALELRPGDLVTTGTVTRAFPVRPGESWRTEVEGLPVPGLHIRFA